MQRGLFREGAKTRRHTQAHLFLNNQFLLGTVTLTTFLNPQKDTSQMFRSFHEHFYMFKIKHFCHNNPNKLSSYSGYIATHCLFTKTVNRALKCERASNLIRTGIDFSGIKTHYRKERSKNKNNKKIQRERR